MGSSIATLLAYQYFFAESASRTSIGIAQTAAWQEILLCLSIITASISCMKAFLDAFRSGGLITIHGRNKLAYEPSALVRGPETHNLTDVHAKPAIALSPQSPARPPLHLRHSSTVSWRFRTDRVSYKAHFASYPAAERSTGKHPRMPESIESFRSDQHAIHRDFEIRVTHSSR